MMDNDGGYINQMVSLHQAQSACVHHSTCPERVVSALNPSAACSVFGFPGPLDLQCSNRQFLVKVNSRSVVPDKAHVPVFVHLHPFVLLCIESHNDNFP